MRRTLVLIISTLLGFAGLTLVATTAAAQDVDAIVASVDARGYYIEEGAPFDLNTIESLTAESASEGRATAIIILVAEPTTMVEDDIAASVIEEVEGIDAALVMWGEVAGSRGMGAAGLEGVFGDVAINDAADAVVDASVEGSTLEDLAATFIDELPQVEGSVASGDESVGSGSESTSSSSSSGGGFPWIIVLIPGIGLLIWWFMRSRRKKAAAAAVVDPNEVETARNEIREQLKVVANEILEHENTVGLSGNESAIEYYRQASETYKSVSEKLETTTNLLDLADLNDQVDRARWQMDAAEALVEGRPVPPEPEPDKPAACFFDPTHKPGIHEATVNTSAGSKEVNVCGVCAEKLKRGERPEPRMIDVGGRRVPAAKAPKSHGGRGMGGLDIFNIILGGLGAVLGGGGHSRGGMGGMGGMDIDWGSVLGNKRRTRSSSGVFGPDRLPPRTSGFPRRGGGGGGSRRVGGRARRRM